MSYDGRVHIWIKQEDRAIWDLIRNKPEWLHDHLNLKYILMKKTDSPYAMFTGQEWYDRFMEDIDSMYYPDTEDWRYSHLQLIEAAKHAARLK